MNEDRQRPLWPVLIAYGVVLVALRLRGYMGLSGDDFFRVLLTDEWVRHPFLTAPSEFGPVATQWLPTHFWIAGPATWLTRDAVISLVALSAAATTAGLWLMHGLTTELFDHRAGWFSSVLLGSLTLYLWLGVSHTEYPLYLALLIGSMWQLMAWVRGGKRRRLLLAAGLMLGVTMFRMEGWTFAVVFPFAVVAGMRLRRESIWRPASVVAVALPFLFVATWMVVMRWSYGNPLQSLAVNRAQIVGSQVAVTDVPLWANVLKFPGLMALTSPALCLAILAWLVCRGRDIGARSAIYLASVGGYILVVSAAYVAGFGTEGEPRRYTLVGLVLLIPLAADLIARLEASGRTRRLTRTAVVLYVGVNLAVAQRFPTFHGDAVRAGRYLAGQFDAGTMPPGRQVATDWIVRQLTGAPYEHYGAFIVGTSDLAGIAAYSRHPTRFALDVKRARFAPPRGPVAPPAGATRLAAVLAARHVCKVAVSDHSLASRLPPHFTLEAWFGRYVIFSTDDCRPPSPWQPPAGRPGVVLDRAVSQGVTLVGYSYGHGLLPRDLTLHWLVEPGLDPIGPSQMEISFRLAGESQPRYRRTMPAMFGWAARARAGPIRLQDAIDIRLPPDAPSGYYRVAVAIPPRAASIALGRVPLVPSKRQVLIDWLVSGSADWSVLWRTIASL